MLNGRHARVEGARLTQQRQKEGNMVHIANPGSEAGKYVGLAAEAR